MALKWDFAHIENVPEVAEAINSQGRNIVLFFGDLGAGKTTIIKEICRQRGVNEEMSSPTFSIVNEYQSSGGKVYHFDLYRIEDAMELLDLGFEDYLDSGDVCLIEWPEIAENILQAYDASVVRIRHNNDGTRAIFVE